MVSKAWWGWEQLGLVARICKTSFFHLGDAMRWGLPRVGEIRKVEEVPGEKGLAIKSKIPAWKEERPGQKGKLFL